jgi:DNA-binding winged helix-turn-helix (wHTH) protein/predicted ATPase
MGRDDVLRFGRYVLDPRQGLTRSGRPIHVTQKSLDVLRLLAGRAGQIVTKEDLFGSVWADTAVSDAALTSCIRELRRALGDDAREPRYIETLHRKGFRFLAQTLPLCARIEPPAPAGAHAALIGREHALGVLSAALARAQAGARQVVLITGELGIGKTALLDAFVSGCDGLPSFRSVRGDCAERYTAGEPYQPLLEALTRLCRPPDGRSCLEALRQYAPTWLAQLPGLQTAAEQRALHRRTAGVTSERMMRELNDCLEAVATNLTLLLWIDDLHWSDASSVDWMTSFARRPERARVLLVGTYRTGSDHWFESRSDLFRLQPWCRHVTLSGLDAASTRQLVERWFPSAPAEAVHRLALAVHEITDGHPLFITVLLDSLRERAAPGPGAGEPDVGRALALAGSGVPDTLRRLLERQLDRLPPADRERLQVASLLGRDWSAAAVAAAVHQPLREVEAALLDLARRRVFIVVAGTDEWPDGTIAGRFTFVHGLHREVLHDLLPDGRRAELHRLIGERLECAFPVPESRPSAQLALHFEQARVFDKAVRYWLAAGQADRRRGASEEARRALERARDLLPRLPPSPSREELEIEIQIVLGGVLMTALGWGAPEVDRAFDRARELCDRLDQTPQLFPSIWGMWLFRWGRGDLASARHLADALERLARGSPDPLLHAQMHHAWWATSFSSGDLERTLAHAGQGFALYSGAAHSAHSLAYGNHDAGVCSRLFASRALALQGRLAAAVRMAAAAVEQARELDHPFTRALALVFAASVHHTARDAERARDRAAEAIAIGETHGFRLACAWARSVEGWALAELGAPGRAADVCRSAVADALATGSHQFGTFLLGLLAEVQLKAGRIDQATITVGDALETAHRTGERFHEAELHRLLGEALCAGSHGADAAGAETSFRAALATATAQRAHLLALRAAMGLARVWRNAGRREDARDLVAEALAALPADADPPEAGEARDLAGG